VDPSIWLVVKPPGTSGKCHGSPMGHSGKRVCKRSVYVSRYEWNVVGDHGIVGPCREGLVSESSVPGYPVNRIIGRPANIGKMLPVFGRCRWVIPLNLARERDRCVALVGATQQVELAEATASYVKRRALTVV